jgi:hypothetical protein
MLLLFRLQTTMKGKYCDCVTLGNLIDGSLHSVDFSRSRKKHEYGSIVLFLLKKHFDEN